MTPRLISARQLRTYLGVDGAGLCRMRKAGSIPNPVPGTTKYDFEAVKRALDRLSGPDASIADAEARLIGRARQWGKSA